MRARKRNLLVMLVVLGASSASAIDPAIKCQSDKLRLAAKYTACRLNAEADAARDFDTPDFSQCRAGYLSGWKKAEARAQARGTQCWTSDDAEVVEGDIDSHTGALAEWLAGGKP
ncbi:MAG: hypothetical protein SF182_26325 [Deltaproteobacteria bacterium]|nr:hypothetical protein [Deltaproteobacteria bacterium]